MTARWIFIRCRMKANRPEFNTDDWRAVVKGLQDYADAKPTDRKRYPIGSLEYKMLGDRLMFYSYDRYGVRYEYACLQRIEDDDSG